MKYKNGDKVYHKSKKRYGIILNTFDTETGPRYYVKHSKFVWSIPESYLAPVSIENDENKDEENQ